MVHLRNGKTHAGSPLSISEKEGEKTNKNQELLTTYINVCRMYTQGQEGQSVIVLWNSSGANPELLLAAAVVGYRIGFTSAGHKNDLPRAFLALFS